MLESLLIGLIVVVAAAYAVWALLPVSTRRNLALKGAHALGGPGAPGVAGKAAGLLQRIARTPAGGCSDCPAATLTPAERAKQQQQK
ncbi:MAG TPA: hypothetical protein VFI92_14660 [Steroidobacteraceae bacterium]|nr:hypothetical protein [Steroidobacteraceae bacterium]